MRIGTIRRWLSWLAVGLMAAGLAACGEGVAGTDRRSTGYNDRNISDPTTMTGNRMSGQSASEAETPALTGVTDVAIRGGYAYALVPDTLVVVALDKPAEPKIAARQALPRSPRRLAFDGVHAYIACGPGGLQIINVGQPREPAVAGVYAPETGQVEAVGVANGVAVVSMPAVGVAVLDVQNPLQPVERKLLADLKGVREVLVEGERAYLVGPTGLTVLDLAKPDEPKVLGTLESKAELQAIGGYLSRSVLVDAEGLHLMVLRSPERPVRVASLTDADAGRVFAARLAAELASGDGTDGAVVSAEEVVAPEADAAPVEASDEAAATDHTEPGLPTRLAISDGRLYISRGLDGVWAAKLEEPQALTPLWALPEVAPASAVAASGSALIVGTADGRLVVFNTALDKVEQAAELDVAAAARTAPAAGSSGAGAPATPSEVVPDSTIGEPPGAPPALPPGPNQPPAITAGWGEADSF